MSRRAQKGWLDEGLTDYQTNWAQNLTPQERATHPQEPPLLPSGYRVDALTNHIDIECLDWSTLFLQNIDDVVRNAGGQRCQQYLRRTLTGFALAIDAGRRSVGTTRIESMATYPLNVDSRRFRAGLRRRASRHFSGPFSI